VNALISRENMGQKVKALSILGILILISFGLDPIVSGILLTFSIAMVLAGRIQGSNYLLNFVTTLILEISLAPLYLILRGYIRRDELQIFDLQIYLATFSVVAIMATNNIQKFELKKQKLEKFKKLFFSSSSLIFLIILELFLRSQSLGKSVAWVMSGDNKNHVALGHSIVLEGWLNPKVFMYQPISAASFTSLTFSQDQASRFSIEDLLTYQLQIYVLLWILFIGMTGIALAAFAESIRVRAGHKKLSSLELLVISAFPLLSVISGPAVYDGFFSAILSICVLLTLSAWFVTTTSAEQVNFTTWIIGLLLFISAVFSWMFTAFFALPMVALALWRHLQSKYVGKRYRVNLAFSVSILAVLSFLHFSKFAQDLIYRAKVAFSAGGAIAAPKPEFYFGLILLLGLFGLFHQFHKFSSMSLILDLLLINTLALFVFKFFGHLGFNEWNYYSLKFQWILASTLFGTIFVFFIQFLNSLEINSKALSTEKIFSIIISTIFLIACLFSEALMPIKNGWVKALKGWENPRSSIVDQVLSSNIDPKVPTMFFHHGYQGDSMLANFWLNAYLDQIEPIRGWNYTIDTTGDVKQLCEVNSYYEKVKVITYDKDLEKQLFEACATEEFEFVVENQNG
jgi:hypothetical protein